MMIGEEEDMMTGEGIEMIEGVDMMIGEEDQVEMIIEEADEAQALTDEAREVQVHTEDDR